MIFWAAAATAGCIAFIVIIVLFVRQINEICRRLAFIRTHKTNMRLTVQQPFRSTGRLIDEINFFLEETAEERLELERESRGLKDSLTGISHDIRTPLTSLSGYFQLLTQTEDAKERGRYSSIIKARIDSLEAMLEELFTYTRLQNGDYQVEMYSLDFTRCVIDTLLAFYGQFTERGIRPLVDIEETPVYIYGNEEAVRRILQNIVKNALVHGTKEVSLSLHSEGENVAFRCSNRCRTPEEIDIEGVFTKFYKADPARKDTSTGLGLTIAAELAKRLKAEIRADLKGDVFTILLRFKRH
ncbi:MAG: HAMP domain-containing histidine kinase [Firmicutes bacterium]|nr:HAMP domain-containing histidine kinase [Bacillota bacterium]